MKQKIIILLLIISIFTGITACKKKNEKNSSISSEISLSSVISSSENSSSESSSAVNSEKGQFYILQEAYDNGWLNQEQLLSIAYYHQGNYLNEDLMGENYTPIPKSPETLSEEDVQTIFKDYIVMKKAKDKIYKDLAIDEVELVAYLGTYGDFVAVKMNVTTTGHTGLVVYEEVAGILYYNGTGGANPIMVYKK